MFCCPHEEELLVELKKKKSGHFKNKSIWDRSLLPTKIELLIIAIYIQKIAEQYKTYIRQICEKLN